MSKAVPMSVPRIIPATTATAIPAAGTVQNKHPVSQVTNNSGAGHEELESCKTAF